MPDHPGIDLWQAVNPLSDEQPKNCSVDILENLSLDQVIPAGMQKVVLQVVCGVFHTSPKTA
jgi:hypothetical protein